MQYRKGAERTHTEGLSDRSEAVFIFHGTLCIRCTKGISPCLYFASAQDIPETQNHKTQDCQHQRPVLLSCFS